jgi:hypothetical protein
MEATLERREVRPKDKEEKKQHSDREMREETCADREAGRVLPLRRKTVIDPPLHSVILDNIP